MRGKILADGDLTYYDEPLTVIVQGRAFDINIDHVRTCDPFDKDNVQINMGTGDLYKDAIEWWKHGRTGLKGHKEYTLQKRMSEINRIRDYVNTMEVDSETLDKVLYSHMFL